MKEENKELIFFMIHFGAIPFLFFHAFIFSIIYYKHAPEVPLFVVLPLMWICFFRIMRYMPKPMHHLFKRKKSSDIPFSAPSLPAYIEAIIWYPVIAIIYYHFHVKFSLFANIDGLGKDTYSILSGYGAYFVASIVGGVISLFIVENFLSIKSEITSGQWKIIKNRLTSVFITYIGVILFFSGLYRWVSDNIDKSFSTSIETTLDAIYFSVVTITTLGYGDITPKSSISKIFVMVESILGVLFLAIMIGLVISTSLSQRPAKQIENKTIKQKIKRWFNLKGSDDASSS